MRQADIRPGRTYVGAGVYYARTVENAWDDGAVVHVRWSVPVANPACGSKAYEKHSEFHICTLPTFAKWADRQSPQNDAPSTVREREFIDDNLTRGSNRGLIRRVRGLARVRIACQVSDGARVPGCGRCETHRAFGGRETESQTKGLAW